MIFQGNLFLYSVCYKVLFLAARSKMLKNAWISKRTSHFENTTIVLTEF